MGLYDYLWHGLHVQDRGKMTQALFLDILQDGVMKTIEWYYFNPCVIFQHDNDPKHSAKLIK